MNFAESVKQKFERTMSAARGADKSFRERAWGEFQLKGLPDRKNEAWKYTNLTAVSGKEWRDAEAVAEVPESIRKFIQDHKVDFEIAVMVNGAWNKKASTLTLESGYEFGANADAGPNSFNLSDGFVSLAAALYRGGYNLRVAPGIVYAKPLLIIHCIAGQDVWVPTLNRIEVGRDAQFNLCELFVGEAANYLRTDVTTLQMEEASNLSWARGQMEARTASHFNEVQAQQKTNSTLTFTQLNAGAAWSRSSIRCELNGVNAEARVNGLSFARDDQHVDQRVEVRHLAPHTNSSQLFKGILKDRARGVLNGKIHIAAGAQKVNSSQLNHNLLLSSEAEADTKPELEIFADDVKANHGATVGRLDEDELFYLLSRGIPRAQAVNMLAKAFASDVLMRIPSRVQSQWLGEQVERTLPEFAAQMEMK